MDSQSYINIVTSRPACQAWEAEADMQKKAVESAIPIALNTVMTAYDFPFIIKTETGTVEEGVAEYVLKGENDDCRDIISITFGSTSNLLDQKGQTESEDWLSGQSTTPTSVGYWVQIGEQQGFPKIKFVGTPGEEAEFTYRYRISQMDIQSFPEVWQGVIVALVEAELFGSAGMASSEKNFRTASPGLFKDTADRKLNQMVDDYSRQGGDADQNYPADLRMRSKNRRRNGLFGY